MVISKETADKVYLRLLKYLTDSQIDHLLEDLDDIPGNKSYRDTIMRLHYLHNAHRTKGYAKGR